MEISNKIPPVTPNKGTLPASQKADKVSQTATTGDRVELSDRAKELQAAFEAVKQMDDVDQEKVARIKAQIEAGTYKVDAGDIAEKMLEESLLGSK